MASRIQSTTELRITSQKSRRFHHKVSYCHICVTISTHPILLGKITEFRIKSACNMKVSFYGRFCLGDCSSDKVNMFWEPPYYSHQTAASSQLLSEASLQGSLHSVGDTKQGKLQHKPRYATAPFEQPIPSKEKKVGHTLHNNPKYSLRSIRTMPVHLRFLDILTQMQRMGYIPILCINAASS